MAGWSCRRGPELPIRVTLHAKVSTTAQTVGLNSPLQQAWETSVVKDINAW